MSRDKELVEKLLRTIGRENKIEVLNNFDLLDISTVALNLGTDPKHFIHSIFEDKEGAEYFISLKLSEMESLIKVTKDD